MTNARAAVHYPVLIFLFAAVLLGCAAVGPPPGDPAQDAELKTFTVVPDKAGLFVYRNTPLDGGLPSTIEVDGQAVGRTVHLSYVYVELPPGAHRVRTSGNSAQTLQFDALPGTITYVWEEVTSSGMYRAGTRLHLMKEDEGRKGVLASRLAGEPFVLKPIAVPPLMQTVQVRVELDSAPATEPIDCEASNDLGRWVFRAPGALTVQVSTVPLQLACWPPEGFTHEQMPLPPHEPTTRSDNATQGVKSGAIAGTTIGVGLAVASFPIFGPLGALFVVGGAMRGAEVGGFVGMLLPEQPRAYPDPIVLRLKRVAGNAEDAQR